MSSFEELCRSGEMFRCVYHSAVTISHYEVLLHIGLTHEVRIVSKSLLPVLDICREFRTSAGHVSAMAKVINPLQIRGALLQILPGSYPGGDQQAYFIADASDVLRGILSYLWSNQLLESESQVINRCRSSQVVPAETAGITKLAIPTRDRPACLGRALSSYIENRSTTRTCEYMVVDSSTPQFASENRAAAISLSKKYSVPVSYTDLEDREDFGKMLSRISGVDERITSFAIMGMPRVSFSAGAARNFIMLKSIGSLVIQADDDTFCDITEAPQISGGYALSSQSFGFYSPDEMKNVTDVKRDYRELHECLLGKTAGAALSSSDPLVSRSSQEQVNTIEDPATTIVATMGGSVGDSGQNAPISLALTDMASWRRLTRTATTWRRAVVNKQVTRSVTDLTLTDNPFCISLNLGLDLSKPLPPFCPVFRNEDAVFSHVMRHCFPNYYIGLLPWNIRHEPSDRCLHSQILWDAVFPRFSTLILGLLRFAPRVSRKGGGLRTMMELGQYYEQISLLPRKEFAALARASVVATYTNVIREIENKLNLYHGQEDIWTQDLVQYQQVVQSILADPDSWHPRDVMQDFGAAAPDMYRRVVGLYGGMLSAWPEILRAALLIQQEGR